MDALKITPPSSSSQSSYTPRSRSDWTPKKRPPASGDAYERRMEAKDYSYELGVTLGAARGNMPGSLNEGPAEIRTEWLLKEFIFMLNLKKDPRIVAEFDKYWATRPKPKSGAVVTITP